MEVFGVITIEEEVREDRYAIELEDVYKEEVANLTEEINKIVHQCEQQEVVTIKDIFVTPPQNPNMLTKEDIKNIMSNTTLPCTNIFLLEVVDYPNIEVAQNDKVRGYKNSKGYKY